MVLCMLHVGESLWTASSDRIISVWTPVLVVQLPAAHCAALQGGVCSRQIEQNTEVLVDFDVVSHGTRSLPWSKSTALCGLPPETGES